MLRQKIPAQVLFNKLNPNISPSDIDNIIISTTNRSWDLPIDGKPRVALNNFGAAGSNVTMVVGEYIPSSIGHCACHVSSYVFGLSVKDEVALGQVRSKLICWLQENEDTSVAHLSYTLTTRRQIYPHRLVITAGTIEEVISQFQRAIPVQVQQQDIPSVVFVPSSQGSQYHGMGSSLYRSSPLFKKYITECDSILRGLGFRSMLHVITWGDEQ